MKLLLVSLLGLFGHSFGHAPFGERFDVETLTDTDELPYAEAMFKVSRSPPSLENEPVEMMCQLSSGQTLIDKTCRFKTPDGQMLSFTPLENDDSPVLYENGTEVEGIMGGASNLLNNLCQLTIAEVQLEYFGRWYCYLNSTNMHIGTLTILNKEVEMYVKDVRLPGHITPSEYSIELEPHIEEGDFTIDGSVEMTFTLEDNIEDPVLLRRIFLHAKNILIYEGNVGVYLKEDPEVKFPVVGHEYGFERDFYVIHLENDLPHDKELVVTISFTSYLNDHLTGFYRSRYVDQATGEEKYLAVTQFESHYARQAFPCMDEPDKKAKFNIDLIHDSKFNARSNMDYFSVQSFENFTISSFKQSVPMSTYLVAFLVSDFGITIDVNNKDYKIWHQKSKTGQADLAAKNGAKILEFYEKFFGVEYPLPKMDMAAIPDFSAGAMENWGLITYRETLLLFVEGVSDADNYESILKVMAHELAHQWFGNLVTMKWWTDLWLNEGFATYTQYHAMNEVFPESRARDRMVLFDVQYVFGPDALENTAPLSKEVNNPNFDADFGAIEYSKGCSILRMLENFLTLETFKRGVSNYLKEKSFQNAEMDDLWMALSNAAREDNRLPPEISVKDIMDGWTLQEGYPVVKVELSDANFVQLSQKRFYLNPTAKETSNSTWLIPINLAYPKAQDSFARTTASDWMLSTGTKLNLFVQHKPYIINVQETGYYRVNYDNQNWNDIIKVLAEDHSQIHELNRAQLIDDSMNLARAKQVGYEIALGLTEYLIKEREYIPWQSALKSFSFIDLMLNDNSSLTEYSYLQSYITNHLEPFYREIGFFPKPEDDHIRKLTRKSVLTWLCKYGQADCVESSKALFEGFMNKPEKNPIDADLREVVYTTAIRNGGDAEWNFLWNIYLKETVDSEKNKIIFALGASASETSITRYLEETLGPNIRLQDVIYVYRGIGAYAPGRRFQFEWLKSNWEKVRDYFSERFDSYAVNLIDGYSRAANTEKEIKILEDFLEEKRPELGTAIYEIQRFIETAKINLSWMNENKEIVANWLRDRVDPTTTTVDPVTTSSTTASTTTSGSNPTIKLSETLFISIIFASLKFFIM